MRLVDRGRHRGGRQSPVDSVVGLLRPQRVACQVPLLRARALAGPRPGAGTALGRLLGDVRTGRFERTLAALAAAGAVITAAEIFSEHDGASFGNKMMWWPVLLVPTMAPAGVAAVCSRRAAHTVLPLASAAVVANGLQGTVLHWRGILQKPGGAANLGYNVEMGPPMFAPLLASLVGAMGLLASLLRREGEPGGAGGR